MSEIYLYIPYCLAGEVKSEEAEEPTHRPPASQPHLSNLQAFCASLDFDDIYFEYLTYGVESKDSVELKRARSIFIMLPNGASLTRTDSIATRLELHIYQLQLLQKITLH